MSHYKKKILNKTKDGVYLKVRCGQYFYFLVQFLLEFSGVISRGLSSKGACDLSLSSVEISAGSFFFNYYYFGHMSILDCP